MKKLFTKLREMAQMIFLFVRVVFTLRVGRSANADEQDKVSRKEDVSDDV